MEELFKELQENIQGEVRYDEVSRKVYSVDASIYEIEPMGVVIPKTKEDIVKIVEIAKKYEVSLIARGAATGITGGCIGAGLVVDVSKYLRRVLEINVEEEYVVCEPGVIQDNLNALLSEKGYRLGPDTSTGNRATLGGMLANNAAGSRSLKYGIMVDHVLGVEMVLGSGEVIRFGEVDDEEWDKKCLLRGSEGKIYRETKRIRDKYFHQIEKHFPKIPRRVSGYNLDQLIKPGSFNISRLITGSEGTLGIVTEIKMRIAPKPKRTGLCVIHLHKMKDGLNAIEKILQYHPIAVEMIDDKILEMGKSSPSVHDKLDWLEGKPEAVFAVELEEDPSNPIESKLNIFAQEMKSADIGYSHVCLTDPETMSHVWEVRKAGLGLLLSKRSYSRAIAFIEDISVPPEELADFMEAFQRYLKGVDKEAGIYGHVGSGCLHIRPYIDLRQSDELQLMKKIMHDVTKLLLEHNGSLSGEHGDGLVRSWLLKELYGEKICQAFVELKEAFDPDNRMNPGKIVHPEPVEEHLRINPQTKMREIETFLDFSKEGGFSLSADMCNGNAQCRKPENTMCPSFQATHDEYHTTRARAQTLRAIITGKLPFDELTGEGLRDVMDLCISCKGCKKECPSQVDMAKMKAELLYQYHEKNGYSFRDKLFGYIGRINQISSPLATLFNKINQTAMAKSLLKSLGIAPERDLPTLAPQKFSQWFRKHKQYPSQEKKVVLFNDTFTEFNTPKIGIAATNVLQALGYTVIVPPWQCCGRPMISKGMLKQAKKYAERLLHTLKQYAEQNIPIIGLEPSCILTIKDEFQGLLGYDNDILASVIQHCFTFDEFLAQHIIDGKLPLTFDDTTHNIKVHGHCHQKALTEHGDTLHVLKCIPNATVTEIPSGCCGMAGSFGYEKEHYNFSMKIAELQLLPAIRNAPPNTTILANGFSCRCQISHATNQKALHLAEILFNSMR
ncbi:MAG: Anaerobic glycerol-3-phosphate dehydrogenase subunit C [Chlamydiae bacterium]|nr:Anaerobic glycerol-3-phosphate dehydrogenase subunit C [Chlamydiota bacterium]